MNAAWVSALVGGCLIGVSVSIMLLFNGRVTGISGIINGALKPRAGDFAWRVFFIAGLICGGWALRSLMPSSFSGTLNTADWTVAVAGLLVGFGTVMSGGCTSGHGVCGISRLSPRSILATILFITAGVLTVFTLRKIGVPL